MDPTTRFWSYVEKTDTCWNWKGPKSGGYGVLWIKEVPVRAHRYSYELHKEQIPAGILVCHRCDNPACVNPDHLFLGSQQDNMDDKVAKGRQCRGDDHWMRQPPERRLVGDKNGMVRHPEKAARGEAHGRSKLNEELVRKIRILYSEHFTQYEIADAMGVSQPVISSVLRGATWGHVK